MFIQINEWEHGSSVDMYIVVNCASNTANIATTNNEVSDIQIFKEAFFFCVKYEYW